MPQSDGSQADGKTESAPGRFREEIVRLADCLNFPETARTFPIPFDGKPSRREKAFINPAGGKAVSGETGFNFNCF